jgi:hypothetical protein
MILTIKPTFCINHALVYAQIYTGHLYEPTDGLKVLMAHLNCCRFSGITACLCPWRSPWLSWLCTCTGWAWRCSSMHEDSLSVRKSSSSGVHDSEELQYVFSFLRDSTCVDSSNIEWQIVRYSKTLSATLEWFQEFLSFLLFTREIFEMTKKWINDSADKIKSSSISWSKNNQYAPVSTQK